VALGETFGTVRRYGEAESAFRRGIALAPDDPYPYTELALLQLRWNGDPEDARAHLADMPGVDNGETRRVRYLVALFDRKWDEALEVISGAPVTVFEAGSFYQPASLLEGIVHKLAGDQAAARTAFETASAELASALDDNPDDHRVHAALGLAHAGLGEAPEAVRRAERAVELYPLESDALGAPVQMVNLALVHAMLGDGDAAARHLREALSIPSTMSVAWLENDPRWDPVRASDPFVSLLAEFGAR